MRVSELAITIAALALIASVVGCASPTAPAMQTIRVQTPGCAIASCELSNDRGNWQLSRTPGSVTVAVSRDPLKLICRADESSAGTAMARSSRPATSGTGAVTGGVAGGAVTGAALGATALAFIPPLGVLAVLTGAGVGAVAGEAAESHSRPLRYPDSVSVPLNCSAADSGSAVMGLKGSGLGLGIRGMTLAEAMAAGLSGRTAVIVTSVVPEGRAAASGLRDGDVVLAANGQDLGDAADLEERVLALPDTVPLTLRVWRDRRAFELVLTRVAKEAP